MQNDSYDITLNLSSDPIESEQQLYNRILAFFKTFKEEQKDSTIWEGKTYVKLMQLLRKNGNYYKHAIWNAIVLILALFSAWEGIIPSIGIDVKNLSLPEQKTVQKILHEAFMESENPDLR